ncbi:MAG: amidohydrolase family protein, partial [Planctomycetes bacterium]|nr:amidohydrolase family protein [Planctomycetota bacterium]
ADLRINARWTITMNGNRASALENQAVFISNGRILAVESQPDTQLQATETLDLPDHILLPGYINAHGHAAMSLFRGLADDLPLLPWLEQRIWPLEHAHDEASTRLSARLTFAELLRSGTTTVQTMESVRHAEVTAEIALRSGLTVITGNCLMDVATAAMPAGMATTATAALAATDALRRAFHGRGRLAIAVAPRFVLSCSEELARDAAAYAEQHGLRLHSHAAEHPDEVAAVRSRFGRDYLEVLHDQGLLGPRTALAHCVHLSPHERELLVATDTAVLHCPSTNLKLGSGIAAVAELDARGVRLALGADGAPCNNRLSMPTELRQAALLQSLVAGPGAWPAARALWTATRGGALALGLHDVGQLAPGCRADLVLWSLGDPLLGGEPAARIVYGATERHIDRVVLGGEVVDLTADATDGELGELAAAVDMTLPAVLARAGLAR